DPFAAIHRMAVLEGIAIKEHVLRHVATFKIGEAIPAEAGAGAEELGAALRRRDRRDAETAVQIPTQAHTQPCGGKGVEVAERETQTGTVLQLQSAEAMLQPPAVLIREVDEWLVV